jgi:DNA-binding FadR family transcriptional regulator
VAAAIGRRSPEEAEKAMHKLLAGTARDLEPAFHPRNTSKRHPKGGGKS